MSHNIYERMFVSVRPRAYALERIIWVYIQDLRHAMDTAQKCRTCACRLGTYATIPTRLHTIANCLLSRVYPPRGAYYDMNIR